MAIEVRRAADRFTTRAAGRTTHHSFSFGAHYNPANVGHGLLVANNDDLLLPGCGYGRHRHTDLEIVSWVLEGALSHRDSQGNAGLIGPGLAQRLSAGSGVEHSERNEGNGPARFVQMWVRPDQPDRRPSYAQHEVADALAAGALVPVASGLDGVDAAIGLNARATFHVARLPAGREVQLPAAPYLHAFVTRGTVVLEDGGPLEGAVTPDTGVTLEAGDAVRLSEDGGRRITARTPSELLVWEMRP